MKRYIEIVVKDTEEIHHRMNVTGRSEITIEQIENGINRNLNHEKYYTRITKL